MFAAALNKSGICPICNEATCSECNACRWCEEHKPDCSRKPKAAPKTQD